MPVVHADVYRLGSMNEFDDLDVLEMSKEGVLVIEWGEAIESALPTDHLKIEFDVLDDQSRLLRFKGEGSWANRDLEGLS